MVWKELKGWGCWFPFIFGGIWPLRDVQGYCVVVPSRNIHKRYVPEGQALSVAVTPCTDGLQGLVVLTSLVPSALVWMTAFGLGSLRNWTRRWRWSSILEPVSLQCTSKSTHSTLSFCLRCSHCEHVRELGMFYGFIHLLPRVFCALTRWNFLHKTGFGCHDCVHFWHRCPLMWIQTVPSCLGLRLCPWRPFGRMMLWLRGSSCFKAASFQVLRRLFWLLSVSPRAWPRSYQAQLSWLGKGWFVQSRLTPLNWFLLEHKRYRHGNASQWLLPPHLGLPRLRFRPAIWLHGWTPPTEQ